MLKFKVEFKMLQYLTLVGKLLFVPPGQYSVACVRNDASYSIVMVCVVINLYRAVYFLIILIGFFLSNSNSYSYTDQHLITEAEMFSFWHNSLHWGHRFWHFVNRVTSTHLYKKWNVLDTWWRHQMETFSTLLALCAGNSPVTGDSSHKGQWRGALMFPLICASGKQSRGW